MNNFNLKNISYGEILKEYDNYEETSNLSNSISLDSSSLELIGGKGQ